MIRPPSTQTATISQGEPTSRAMVAGVRKMPDPMLPPMAIIVMSNSVRLRLNSAMPVAPTGVCAPSCGRGARVEYHGRMALRNIIRIDEALCDGCGECVPSCAEGALQVIDGKARLVSDVLCDGLGACLGECPTGALTVIQREAPEFDEAAVTAHRPAAPVHAPSGCPSSAGAGDPAGRDRTAADGRRRRRSRETRPGAAPVAGAAAPGAADRAVLPRAATSCSPPTACRWPWSISTPSFLDGRGLAIACPKLDQHLDLYVQKLAAMIDEAGILSLTVAIMEVPCCGGLVRLAQQALAAASRQMPLRLVKVGIRGDILDLDTEA